MTHCESAPPVTSLGPRSACGAGKSRSDGGEAWRRIYEPPGTAADLLAGSEHLLAAVGAGGAPALRWYVTPQPALVLGVGQPLDDFDAAACARAGLSMVRRSSGGTAVLADDGLLNLDVVLPAAHRLGHRDVVRAYAWLGAGLTRALRRLGWVACAIAPDEARRDTAMLRAAVYSGTTVLRRTCFGGRSPYEVLVAGRKVVGLCQVRRRAGTLYQVGIILGFDAARLAGLLSGPPAERAAGAARLGRRACGLHTLPRAQSEPVIRQVTRQDCTTLPPIGLCSPGSPGGQDCAASGTPTPAQRAAAQRMLGGLAPAYRAVAGEIIRGVERAIAEMSPATYRLADPHGV